jgi:LSD1 subclass zinc finger protein
MKRCSHCGKDVPDYAKRCKYCENPLPDMPADPNVHQAQSFDCPACGAPLTYTGGEPVIVCSYCNNSVIAPDELRRAFAPPKSISHHPRTLSEELEQFIGEGKREKAVTLLRDRAFLLKTEAEELVRRVETGDYGDLGRLIYDTQRGRQ